MLVRWLVVVLMMVGQMPFQVCTCNASPTSCSNPNCTANSLTGRGGCSCGHHHHDDPDESPLNESTQSVANHTHAAQHHAAHHHPACPCIQVRVTPDATIPVEIAASEFASSSTIAFSHAAIAPIPQSSVALPFAVARAPACPLFITLLTLRN